MLNYSGSFSGFSMKFTIVTKNDPSAISNDSKPLVIRHTFSESLIVVPLYAHRSA